MKIWQMNSSLDFSGLRQVEAPTSPPRPGEASVRLKAASINHRDTIIARGYYPFPVSPNVIPLSDGCWEVTAVGEGVTRVKPGQRVINIFARGWLEGPLEQWMWDTGFGAALDGTLTQQTNLPAEALVPIPDSLSDFEAATLPCAGVTAWNALFGFEPALKPGETVLTLGTGGVSIFAIQLAKAAGAKVIATSSSRDKLDRARKLGADVTIDYSCTPEWHQEVLTATNGRGADIVIEVGGPGTMVKSLSAVRYGGRIPVIGALSDPMGTINPGLLLMRQAGLHGVMVGSRRHTEELVRAVEVNHIQPVVDRVYKFDDAARAFPEMLEGKHFGKFVISA